MLGAIEGLARDGFLIDTVSGIQRAATPLSDIVARSLSASRRVAANRSLAVALQESGETGLDVATHFERAGEWARAFDGYLAAADHAAARSDPTLATAATNGALRCLDQGATTDQETRGRLLSLVLATSGSAHIPIAYSTTSAPQHRCSTVLSG